MSWGRAFQVWPVNRRVQLKFEHSKVASVFPENDTIGRAGREEAER